MALEDGQLLALEGEPEEGAPSLPPVRRVYSRAWAGGASFLLVASLAAVFTLSATHEEPPLASLADLSQTLRLNQKMRGADAQVDIPFEGVNYSEVFNETGSRPGRLSSEHRTVTLAGFSRPELNARFTERFGLNFVVYDRETYWTVDLSYYLYWCTASSQWIVGWGANNFENARDGKCDYTAVGPVHQDILDPNKPRGWSEWKNGQLVDAPRAGVDVLATMEWLDGKGSQGAFDALDLYPFCKRPPYQPINFFRVYTDQLTEREELTSNTNYNQGSCNNCWAVTISELVARVLCLTSDGNFQGPRAQISPAYITSCAVPALATPDDGCTGGGKPLQALWWIAENGVPTGGNHYSDQTCVPFFETSRTEPTHAPACPTACTHPDYPRSLKEDLFFPEGLRYTYQTTALESALKAMRDGPIAVVIPLYEDFYNYTMGTYRHQSGERIGNHIMVAHGYTDDYIQGFNSWGPNWGYMGNFRVEKSFPLAFIIPGRIAGFGDGYPYPLPSSTMYARINGFENLAVNGKYSLWIHQIGEMNDHVSWWNGDELVMYWCPTSMYWAIANVSRFGFSKFNVFKKGWRLRVGKAAKTVHVALSRNCDWLVHGPVLTAYTSVPTMPDMYLKGWFEKSSSGMELVRPQAGIEERG